MCCNWSAVQKQTKTHQHMLDSIEQTCCTAAGSSLLLQIKGMLQIQLHNFLCKPAVTTVQLVLTGIGTVELMKATAVT